MNRSSIMEVYQILKDAVSLLPSERGTNYSRRISAVEKRLNDPMLNLAVIGDFSCGKSTFLNALLGRRLLSMDLQPTTAVPTYIRWMKEVEKDFWLTATDSKQRCYMITGPGKKTFERYLKVTLPEDQERLIDAITTDNRLAGKLERVEITFPYRQRYDGICLIDTPGVNPGAESTREHIRLTQHVLSSEADAAIVLFPATQVFTASFQEFLEEHTQRFLRNSIFIVTMMDLVTQERDYERLPWFVAENLKRLGVEEPRVYGISAGKALNYYTDGETHPEYAPWAEKFETVVEEIFENLGRQRERIIHESISAMLGEIIEEVRKDISEGAAATERAEAEIKAHSPYRMNAACKALKEKYLKALKIDATERRTNAYGSVQSKFEYRKSVLQSGINRQTSIGDVNKYLKTAVDTHMTAVSEWAQQALCQERSEMNAQFTELSKKMQKCFSEYRVSLEEAAHTRASMIQVNLPESHIDDAKVNMWSETTVLSTLGDLLDDVGDILDDALELNVLDLVGDVFLLIGNLLENVIDLFTPFQTRRQRMSQAVANAVDKACKETTEQYIQKISEFEQQYWEAANKLLEDYQKAYAGEFAEAKLAFETNKRENQSVLKRYRDMLARLESALESVHGDSAV